MDATDTNMKVAERNLEIDCWFFEKPHTNLYLMRGAPHRTRALELENRHRTAVRNPIFEGWHSLEMFAVPQKDQHLHNVSVPVFWRSIEASRMLCVPSPLMFAYFLRTFGGSTPRFGLLLLKIAMTDFTIMLFYVFLLGCAVRRG